MILRFGMVARARRLNLLANVYVGIISAAFHPSSKILNFPDGVLRKHQPAKFGNIKPFVTRFSKGTIVKIKAINVNVSTHNRSSEKAEATRINPAASHPAAEATGGISTTLL
jgi:hypothetical protein